MQYFLLGFLAIPFLYINYKIIISDLKEKKIPNKLLGYLLLILPIHYIYTFYYFDINYLYFIFQIFLTLIVSFILYYFGIWSAGDAKYLIILSLFIPNIGIIPFIGNIAILTLVYLFLYFLWFYFGKCLFDLNYSKNLYINIFNDLKNKWIIYKDNEGGTNLKIILKWLILFLIIFISIRLIRDYFIYYIIHENSKEYILLGNSIYNLFHKYNIYLLIILYIFIIFFIFIIRKIIILLRSIIRKKSTIEGSLVSNITIFIVFIILVSYIVYEYINNPYYIELELYKIFNIYLILFIAYKSIYYMYNVSFSIAEYYFINIKNLNEGDIVDKDYLIKNFGSQKCLGFLNTNPKKYFLNIINPIDVYTLNVINNVYKTVNNYHRKEGTINFQEINNIKILNTFSFGVYIFIGFLISYFFGNKGLEIIFLTILNIIKYLYNI